ncbi:Panacea domain-containing protein [Fimbriiglobus ruber]|uniref:Panacea domain-containing protein n=1 Tax=Fimbriiglobus ruber TaxID=1908690 RepID=UPI000B4AC0F3|nr:Panacea domain-containing protein [Fimbriiglobus ruber]
MLNYKFNFQKTLQASAVILGDHHGRMEYIRLLKLLYIADRELLAETGRTLTGDHAVAMKRGPVLSAVYELVKNQGAADQVKAWSDAVHRDGYEVVLSGDVGITRLTKAEAKKLHDVCNRFRDTDSEGLSDLTHEFQEWSDVFDTRNPNSCYPIRWESALAAQGAADLIEEAENALREQELADTAFGG